MVGWKNEKEEIGERKIKRGVREESRKFFLIFHFFSGV
jgi:hypothetical protein